jgi:hypothetical protein
MALGIASTAMPFARTATDEAERWLRVLRLHGEAGMALRALGVSEGPLLAAGESEGPLRAAGESEGPAGAGESAVRARGAPGDPERAGATVSAQAGSTDVERRDTIELVTECAAHIAARRGTAVLATGDLLMAVMYVYGEDFDRVLRTHGTDREEVLARLGAGAE